MKTALREDEVIRFMTRAPQVHMMEIIGVNDFDPEKIELEEYVGRIDSVIGEDEALLVTTLSPVDGFRCIAVAGDVIGKVDLSCLSEEELEAYGSVNPRFTAPNVYRNDAATLIEDTSWGEMGPDVRGKRFSTHGAENLSGEMTTIFPTKKQAGHCARPAFIRLPWGN